MAMTSAARGQRYRERAKNHVALVNEAQAEAKKCRAELDDESKKRRAAEAEAMVLKRERDALLRQLKQAIRISPDRDKLAAVHRRVAIVLELTPQGRQRARKRDLRQQLIELIQKADEHARWFEAHPGILQDLRADGEASSRALESARAVIEASRLLRERNLPWRAFIK